MLGFVWSQWIKFQDWEPDITNWKFKIGRETQKNESLVKSRDWSPKFATGLNMIIGSSSKSIWVTRLLFCQNDFLMRGSFWQKDSLKTHILFELQPIIIFSPVANFGNQSLHVGSTPKECVCFLLNYFFFRTYNYVIIEPCINLRSC